MPSKALRFCRHSGCSELVTDNYCPEHAKVYEEEQKKEKERYNKTRESSADRGYDELWRKARRAHLKRHPLCEMCEKQGKITPAVLVHHIKPIGDGGARLDSKNFMSLCRRCHEDIHGKDRFKHKE